ncbi:MAG: acyl-CoA desaturase [Sulfurifustaceae bacterium]
MRHDDLPGKVSWRSVPPREIQPAGARTRSPQRDAVDSPSVAAHGGQFEFLPWYTAVPLVTAHVAVLGAFWTGVGWRDVLCCFLLYTVRMFGVTAGYHRYFSHRSYKANRLVAFMLGVLAETSAQKGILWWTMHHRAHHRHSDTSQDPHSPRRYGFWHAHIGWLYLAKNDTVSYAKVSDLAKYPELVWLDRVWILPPVLLAVGVWLVLGWSGLWMGFFLSTVLLWHATFCINSVAHLYGRRRYATHDSSRNNWILALVTLGEGWHNNHHRYMTSARQGLKWWEIDVTYYVLAVLAWMRIVRDLRPPSEPGRATMRAAVD